MKFIQKIQEEKMKKILMTVVIIIVTGLLMTPGCKKADNQVFDIEGDWVFTIMSNEGAEVTVNFTFNNLNIFTGGNQVGRYVVRLSSVDMEITRPIESGAVVEERYFGAFENDNTMTGTMTRYLDSGGTENFTWDAQR
jgi:hypothetical protein